MRLDKFLSNALDITRSKVNEYIKKNDIVINGIKVIKKDFKIDETKDIIIVNGKKIEYRVFVYYMLNKPAGVVSAVKDNIDKTVVDIIDTTYDIFPIGRLDKDTEGLLILSNDGSLSHYLTSPNHHVDKKYFVKVDSLLNEAEMKEFEEGILIKDGSNIEFKTLPCKIEYIDEFNYYVTINEGKFHQIKRMFHYFNKDVLYLKRVSFGDIKLDDNLGKGKYRLLNDEEIDLLKNELI